MIPESRLRIFNQGIGSGDCVVYWMISARRSNYNHTLEHAIHLATQKSLPLVVVEPLAIAHKWANDRSHTFVIQGMMDNKKSFEDSPISARGVGRHARVSSISLGLASRELAPIELT